jgi:uncharacterized integral membrane protein (TIGR00698 family)
VGAARTILFLALAAAALTPWVPPPFALLLGIGLALSLGNPFPKESRTVSRTLLQAAVVFLGFGVDLQVVVQAGAVGVGFALLSIAAVFLGGWLTMRALKIRRETSLLVTTGTAICGGSAIAAMSSVIRAPDEDVSVAIGTVFLLNAAALFLFPPLGHLLALTPVQFGIWSGIAIHDVASVVGAAAMFPGSLDTATAVKLSRVLYLVPITLIAAQFYRPEGGFRLQVPWFIALFVVAAAARTVVPGLGEWAPIIRTLAVAGFSLSLFLIGAGIGRDTLRAVGIRPLLQGLILWALISGLALLFVLNFV